MGQKSRAKHKKQPKKISPTPSVQATSPVTNEPSLVAASVGFQPKAKPSEDLLQVRTGDIRRIGWLLLAMTVLFVALGLASRHGHYFSTAGTHLSHALGF